MLCITYILPWAVTKLGKRQVYVQCPKVKLRMVFGLSVQVDFLFLLLLYIKPDEPKDAGCCF